MPVRVYWREDQPMLDWCYLGSARFTEPFFEQTLGGVQRHPFACLFRHQTPIESAGELAEIDPGIPPTGFIYHMSRCGSTLISRVLAQLPSNLVLSEPSVLDEAVRARGARVPVDHATRVRWVRWLLGAMGRRRTPEEARFFVKLDCWSICHFEVIHDAFPDVPWIFVHRHPLEVLVSQYSQPAQFTVPGYLDPALLGVDRMAALRLPRHEYCARVLAVLLEAAAQKLERHAGVLVDYRQLPDAIWTRIAETFRLEWNEKELEIMREAAKIDAKSPFFEFQSDSAKKQAEAATALREACARWLDGPYARIEALCHSY